ncbi:MAG TPA: T9SS type A sorting domain-containing protein [Brumimicrobium sp.]|nr:T9SS type A sorting domain-containing protein [Brumimicrobium sp.]
MDVLRLIMLVFAFFTISLNTSVFSQFNLVYNDSIVVIKNSDTVSLAWAGGMSHPQFSTIDLDFDGIEELIAFEPDNGTINVFKRKVEGGNVIYTYWHGGNKFFPTDVKYRMKLVDFNDDGMKDLFTYAQGGVKVYKNVSNPVDGIHWKLYVSPLKTFVDGATNNLYVSSDDIPAFVDVDGDGDLDVLTFHPLISRVEWHKNLSMETYGHADSLIFELAHGCWGDFIESPFDNTIQLNNTTAPCGTALIRSSGAQRHAGGSILALDANKSGSMDLIIGDVDFNNITLLINDNPPDENGHMVSYDPDFPSYDVPVNLSNFLTAYYEDADLDGVKDIIVSTTVTGTADNTKGVWLYKNNGENDSLNLTFVKEDFLQGDMIQNGSGAIPILVDVNNDGLTDLLVSNQFNYRAALPKSSRINYYKNVGTASEPVFELITEDWNSFANSGYTGRVSPAFGDLDGDGDLDMIVGLLNGKLYYYENAGGSGQMNFNLSHSLLKDINGDNISVSNFATPELFDLDNDGKLDLIIGQSNGPLLYYRNVGTATNYSFELMNSNLGMVDLTSSIYNQSVGVPRFTRHNDTTYLFAGNKTGTISYYDGIDDKLNPGDVFNLVSSEFLEIDTRGMSAPAIGKLRNDESFDLFVGTEIGGLWSYRAGDTTFLSLLNEQEITKIELSIYPNPTKGSFTIALDQLNGQKYSYRVLDQLGRVVASENNQYQSSVMVELENPKSGLYFIEVVLTDSLQRVVRKLLID